MVTLGHMPTQVKVYAGVIRASTSISRLACEKLQPIRPRFVCFVDFYALRSDPVARSESPSCDPESVRHPIPPVAVPDGAYHCRACNINEIQISGRVQPALGEGTNKDSAFSHNQGASLTAGSTFTEATRTACELTQLTSGCGDHDAAMDPLSRPPR